MTEFSVVYFDWDDSLRFVLETEAIPVELKLKYVEDLRNALYELIHSRDEKEFSKAKTKIRNIRKELLLTYYTPSKENEKYVKQMMKDIMKIE